MDKSDAAFRTIGEVSDAFGVPQHVLRYWETRFPQLRPIQRAGNRRYYRPSDVALVGRIHGLLSRDGYTVKGVQKLLATKALKEAVGTAASEPMRSAKALPLDELLSIRALLADSLA